MKKNAIAMAIVGMLLLSSFMITPTLALGNPFIMSDPEPTNTSKNVDIYQQTVSVFIEYQDQGGGSTPQTFYWEISGDYVITNSSSNDVSGRKEARLRTPLPYDTVITWNVCATDGPNKIEEIYSFKTINKPVPPEPPIITINITNPDPANESTEIPVDYDAVSVDIQVDERRDTAPQYLAFNWTIGGDNISTNSGHAPSSSSTTVTADIIGPLPSNTRINWYVNVNASSESGEKMYKNATFWFKTFNNPPVADFTNVTNGLKVDFDGSLSYDSDGNLTNYTWYFGDLNISYGNTAQHVYDKDGSYNVRLKVTDDAGKTGNKTIPVNVKNSLPTANFKPTIDGKKVTFDASLSSDEDGTIKYYNWSFGDTKEGYGKIIDHTYVKEDETYNVTLKVTDDKGNYSEITKSVRINDTTKPIVKIVKPVKKGIYVNNETKRSRILGMALIIGDITVEVSATDENGSGIKEVKFYGGLLGKLYLGNDTTAPYTFNWVKGRIRFCHIQILKVVAIDNAGNSATAKMTVRRFL
jgi:chitodextrinase